MRKGGNYCDLFFENSSIWTISLKDSKVSSGGFHRDYGCGIRVLCGDRTGYAYSESTDYESLCKAADAAGAIALCSSLKDKPIQIEADCPRNNGFYPMQQDLRLAQSSRFVELLQKLDSSLRRRESRIVKLMATASYSLSEIYMYNSLGQSAEDLRPLCSLNLSAIIEQNGQRQVRTASKSLRQGLEFFDDTLILELSDTICRNIDRGFEAGRPAGGQMNVVMAAGASGILLHEAMGHAFEADFNRKGQSIFCDKMGQQICRKGINIVDDATIPFLRGSCNWDDELTPGQKTYMVQDGVLTSYLHDRISASCYGLASTGNGRRECFRNFPIPRMRTTYMESAEKGSLEDLIHLAGNGIYVDEFSNGEVQIETGDFTFYVRGGYLIENGRLTRPIKDLNIIGNGPKALAGIEAVASDLVIDTGRWTCGKGQSVPVSCGTPSLLINNLTVGGQ